MTHVTQSENGHSEKWYWPVSGFGAFAIRILQNKLEKKAAGRMACCQNEELMSDLWFDGFPELIEQKQTVGATYSKHTIGEQSDAQTAGEHNENRLIQLPANDKERRRLSGQALARPLVKIAA